MIADQPESAVTDLGYNIVENPPQNFQKDKTLLQCIRSRQPTEGSKK